MPLKLFLLVICAGSISIAQAQNVIINGDFETPPHDVFTVTGWDVTGNVASVSGEGSTSGSYAAAFSVGGNTQGDMLSQTVATAIGQTYSLDFDAGTFGIRSAEPLTLQIQVFGAGMGTLVDDTITPPENMTFNPASMTHYTYTFTADSASTVLKFTDGGSGNGSADVIVDTVSMTSTPITQVPEPGSGALIVIGLAPLGWVFRRIRSRTA
jgi:hypothetical protein